jgi:prepilin-type N-terminal cleavage/methylation domain-containing protein
MRKGLTLIEMLVAVTITTIILAVTVSQFVTQRRHIDMQEQQIKLDRDTRLTLTFIADELRELGLDPKKTHAFGITTGHDSSVAYISDLDQDGAVDPNESLHIFLNGDFIVFNADSIIENGVTFQIAYLDSADSLIAIPALGITESDPFGFFSDTVATFQVQLTTEVHERNRLIARSNQTIEVERKNR